MRKRLIERSTCAKKGSLGYTLTELLTVIGIIAVLCAIAIPSVIAIRDSLRFAQSNDYAKSIFLAAQQNLSELRSDGSLAPLQGTNVSAAKVARNHCGFPAEDWSDEYVYTASDMTVGGDQISAYDLILPVNSVESTVRGEHVIIEYNPITGNVYAVFYCEDDDQQILSKYQHGTLPRDKGERRKMMLGYYDGSGLSSSDLELERNQAEVLFANGEEGVVTVKIPVPSHYYAKHDAFIQGLEVELTITGDNFGGSKVVVIKKNGQVGNAKLDELATSVLITYNLDSLADSSSFANLSVRVEENNEEGAVPAAEGAEYLTQLTDAHYVEGNLVKSILPGDNVTIQADVTFVNEDGDPAVSIRPGILAGINPMFDYLLTSPTNPNKYTLAVANGRNLQNLNAIHPMVADCVDSVVFTDDINWNTTITYYNEEYGSGGGYANNASEAPGRALPYFVPIQNEHLFGTAEFIYANGGSHSSGFKGFLEELLEDLFGGDFLRSEKVPTLTDELDTKVVNGVQIGDTHAKIDGQGHKVCFLKIDATQYQPCASTFYALGEHQSVDYYFAGLFGYVNTTINDLHVVNPIIKGHNFVDGIYMDPATGALVGAAGYNTLVTNCSTYLDTTMEGFNWAYGVSTAQKNYDATASMTWYGVSGEGAVGGLVGYAKSHRTVVGELNSDDTRYLAFANSFAAVPVSGNLRGNTNKDYGYSNGVGGFIGNSQLTNFYNCYSSGKIMARNTYYATAGWRDDAANLLGLGGNGRLAQGAGGFVGTSHGTRYTNCFSTSNVINNNGNAATGGFVGMMCYDATKKYGHHSDQLAAADVAQHTVFDSCYATGMCTNGSGAYLESFSGANGKIVVNYGTLRTFYTGDYYKLLAPYALTHYNRNTNTYTYPPYDELYIFKDSYYLSQYKGTAGVNQQSPSNKCAKPITYDELVNLHLKYDDVSEGGWLDRQVEAAKSFALDVTDINPLVSEILAEIFTLDFNDIIQGIFGNETENVKKVKEILATLEQKKNYEVYFVIDKYRANSLESDYFNRYDEGFPSLPWENASDATTHYYGTADAGKVYPFPKLNTMDYYGLWPEKTLDAGLAYFEVYTADGQEKGYYFDREDTSTLRNTEDVQVLSDGYCIFTANVDDSISVYINDSNTPVVSNLTPNAVEVPVTMESAITPDRNSYYVVNLPWDVLAVPAGDNYYNKMEIVIYNPSNGTTKNVIAYYNPNVAVSQVNSATQPTRMPTAISIRSARQLAALAGEPTMWSKGYNYIQWLNIDVDAYTAVSFNHNDAVKVLKEIQDGGSIGDADHPFMGSYNGAGYAEKADIVNFRPSTSGIFGVIGEGGEVKNLDVIYNKDAKLELGTSDDDNVAVLAGVNYGTISNVGLVLDQEVSLTGKNNAGLMVGDLADSNTENEIQGGVLTDCTLTVNKNVTITAPNTGLVIGAAENAVITDVTATQSGASTFSANADYAGGFAGSLVSSDASDVNVTLNAVTAQAGTVGGFAGYAMGSGENTASTVVVKLNNKLENTKAVSENSTAVYAAGLVGVSDTMKYVNITVNAEHDIVGSSAAGMFGTVNQGSISNARVNIKKTVNGTVDAAGFAVDLKKGDYLVQMAYVNLTTSNSKVLSQGCAAGFAVEAGCNAMTTEVKLGAYDASNTATTTGTVQGSKESAGYACSITGEVSNSHVRGCANITSENGTAAGFAAEVSGKVTNSGVTPAMGDAARNYRGNSNNNLKISGVNAAGFAANVAENASILNSYALGNIQGTDSTTPAFAGFVLENNGTVDGSTANINIEGGYAFVGTNNSLIQNCYAWYSDGAEAYTTFAAAGEGKLQSSYFVDLDIQEEESADGTTVKSVVLYDYSGASTQILPSTLSGALGSLNDPKSVTAEWFGAATYAARPYTNITPATYSYPMLRQHFGDWVTKPQYAYGVMYYELHKAEDGNVQWKYNIMDLTDPAKTVEDDTLSISNDTFTGDGSEILDAGYAVFCKSGVDPSGLFSGVKNWFDYPNAIADETFENQVRREFVKKVKDNNSARYSFYKIKELGDLAFDSADQEGEIRVVTWYANAIGTAGTDTDPFLVRTPEQFGYVGQLPAANFSQTHAIQVPNKTDADGNVTETGKFTTISDFSGTYNGNNLALNVPNGNTWITTLSGTVQDVNLTVSNEVSAPVFGTVNGVLELDAVNVGSVSQNGALVGAGNGTITTGAITTGQIGAGDAPAAIFGSVTGGTVTVDRITTTDKDVYGQIFGDVAAPVTVTNGITTGAVNGKLFGNIGADVTTGNIAMDSASGSKVFEGVSDGTTTLGDITVSSGDVSQLFGAISGGTVQGTVTENKAASIVSVSGKVSNLFISVTGGATLQNFAVQTSGSLSASLIGTVSGVPATENTAAVNTIISNVNVDAEDKTDSFAGSGLLVNSLGDYTTVSDCDVETGVITLKNLASYNVDTTETLPFGGITGVVPANAALTNNTVKADLNVVGMADKLTVVGGMTAINGGEIDGGKVVSNIDYTQVTGKDGTVSPVYDKAGIGGLVGWMLPGSSVSNFATEDTKGDVTPGITGTINLWAEPEESTEKTETVPGDASGREYFIGGAIAFDGGAEYTDVSTEVVVSNAWAGGVLTQRDKPVAVVNPSGKGCVGKFVGYVGDGVFENCAATDAAANYQFLGEIQVNVATVNAEAPYSLYTSKFQKNTDKEDWAKDPTKEDLLAAGYTDVGASYTWYDYPATLNGCIFGWTDADGSVQTYTQDFDRTYIYGGNKVKRDLYKAVNVGMPSYTGQTGLKYGAIYIYDAWFEHTKSNIETGYYYQDASGQYYKVYVDYSMYVDWSNITKPKGFHTYTFKYVDASGVAHEIHKAVDLTDPQNTAYAGPTLWNKNLVNSFSVGDAGTMYMIVTKDDRYALGLNGVAIPFEREFDLESASSADLKKAIWTITKNSNNTRWRNEYDKGQYLALKRDRGYPIYNNGSGENITIEHRNYTNGDVANFNVGGPNYTWLTHGNGFGLSQTGRYSGDEYKFFIYRVDRNGEVWGITFALRPEISESCHATRTDGDGNVIVLSNTAPITADESVEEPAEPTSGEA